MHLRNFLISSCLVPFLAVGGSISALGRRRKRQKRSLLSVLGAMNGRLPIWRSR